MTPLSEAQLAAIMPRANAARWTDPLNEAMARFAIATPDRGAAFLAHVAHESDECTQLTEDLRYSAARLCEVWRKRFPTLDRATPYAHHPEKLANCVYANRMGNGDERSGDGWVYRGRGLFSLTGRANYREAGEALGILLERHPELLEQPIPAALTAGYFWQSRGCNALADCHAGDDEDEDFRRITVLINGGTTGLAARRAYWRKALAVLS